MKLILKFYLIGLTVAILEEFITQGLLRRNLIGSIIPTIIAFFPFLVVVRLIHRILNKKLCEHKAALAYCVIAGGIGLMIEWFIIGLSPWSSPDGNLLLILVFQLGIFSFSGSVAFAPRLLLDKRNSVAGIRKRYQRLLIFGFAFIYFITFLAAGGLQFAVGVISVLATFTSLNFFYFRYIRILGLMKEKVAVFGERVIPTRT